ncbi:hypothetical protein I7I51_04844 [Histoplasma capsulatum]|uniref:Uncharacterized protein n=1 Tax=Ajellomyces capsulatus TaxID=5037 RepID=A0A8A1M0Q9_AJECA|nr:hypothetical protein I7I51_04844 [Histoplasma capsulatum]
MSAEPDLTLNPLVQPVTPTEKLDRLTSIETEASEISRRLLRRTTLREEEQRNNSADDLVRLFPQRLACYGSGSGFLGHQFTTSADGYILMSTFQNRWIKATPTIPDLFGHRAWVFILHYYSKLLVRLAALCDQGVRCTDRGSAGLTNETRSLGRIANGVKERKEHFTKDAIAGSYAVLPPPLRLIILDEVIKPSQDSHFPLYLGLSLRKALKWWVFSVAKRASG